MKQIIINIPEETQMINLNILITGDQVDVKHDGDQLQPDQIINEVCRYMQVTPEKLKSKLRHNRITRARKLAMYSLRMNTRLSFTEIGNNMNRNHSTVITALRQTNNWIETHYQPFEREFRHIQRRMEDLKIQNQKNADLLVTTGVTEETQR